jgi:tripartite-type tricarboxylate transporter receptor subunit TctC
MKRITLRCIGFLAACIAGAATASADAVSDFYTGKTIDLYVAFPPGGGYDLYARAVAPYLTRHIPGNPQILIRNMEGGSGVRAASYISNVTPQDGRALGMFLDNLTNGKVLGGPGEFDPVKMVWIGRIAATATLAAVWHTSKAQSVLEARDRELIIATSVASNSSSFIPLALNDLAGTKFRMIAGYQGSPPMALAMEQGEVEAISAISWEALQLTKPDWLRENKVKFLYTLGAIRLRELPDVPAIPEFARDEAGRRILALLGSGPDIGRALTAEPGIPPARAAALRKAFMETMRDPDFLAEAEKRKMLIDPLSGEDLQKVVEQAAATPADLIERAKKYIGK